MEFENFVKNNPQIFADEDDDILLNPIYYINQFENTNNNRNINTDVSPQQKSIEIPSNKNHISKNSTLNTNAALDESSQNINYNLSFFSFNNEQKKDEKKELTQKSIEILTEFINKEKKFIENKTINNNIIEKEDKKIKILKLKELKNNFEKLDSSMCLYFKRPYMRKNYNKKIFEKPKSNDEQEDDEEEKKISISDEIYEEKKKCKGNFININTINEL